ncbi:uncharacterized protein STAUR_1352 [Stigmatella aurantiaca DW4/3-1]|uniref:Uncharacterized protein n=1 Tax=Stigmatella aurantiaca (strain DW4/3-1) TaxID=378806 RepID=E3FJ61_STIAD|nr:uncharacterized protein STAUR_1352 [Stigmatella aurantiaca DW4/3-1]
MVSTTRSRWGDFQSASFTCVSLLANRLALGHDLDDVHQESISRKEFMLKAGLQDSLDMFVLLQRYIQQMRGHSRVFGSLDGEGFDEQAFEARLTPDRIATLRCMYWIVNLQSRFMSGALGEAREAAGHALGLLESMTGTIPLKDYHLFSALTLAASFDEESLRGRQQALEAIQAITGNSRSGRNSAPRTSWPWSGWWPVSWPASRERGMRRRVPTRKPSARRERVVPPNGWGWPVSWRRNSGVRARRPSSRVSSRARPGRPTCNGEPGARSST